MVDFSSGAVGGEKGARASMRAAALAAVALAGVVAVGYLPVVDAPFVFDDEIDLVNNAAVQQLWPPTWATGSRRPLAWLTFALSWWVGAGSPTAFRAANILIHGLAAFMVFAVARDLLRSPRMGYPQLAATRIAAAAALIWAAHPLHTSAVTYVVHRYESLAALFYLLTLWGLLRSVADPAHRRHWQLLSISACAMGGLVKEILITAPLAALAIDASVLALGWAQALRLRWRFYVGLGAALAPLLWLVATAPAVASQRFDGAGAGPIDYLMSQPHAVGHCLQLALWPHPLAIDYYDWPVAHSIGDWGLDAWLVLGLVVAAVAGTVKRSIVTLPLAFALIVLLPTSTIVPLRHELLAERRMYLPLAALCVAACVLVRKALVVLHAVPWSRGAVWMPTALALLAATLLRNIQYASPVTLYAHEVAVHPGNARAHAWYARYLADLGRLDEAAQEMHTALELDPGVSRIERQAARIADLRGKVEDAARWARLALAREPHDEGAARLAITMLARSGRVPEAVAILEQQTQEHPDDTQWVDWLAWYLATEPQVRDGARALALSERIASRARGGASARYQQTRAAALAAAGRYAEAAALLDPLLLEARSSSDTELTERLLAQRQQYAHERPWTRTEAVANRPAVPADHSPAAPSRGP